MEPLDNMGHTNIIRINISPNPIPPQLNTMGVVSNNAYKEMIFGNVGELPIENLKVAQEGHCMEVSCNGSINEANTMSYNWTFRSQRKLATGTGPLLCSATHCRATLHSILAALYILQDIEKENDSALGLV
jgi:hypothetical protein